MKTNTKEVKKLASTITQEYDYVEYLYKLHHNYISGKTKFKETDPETTELIKEGMLDLAKLIIVKTNRMKVLYISIMAEIEFRRNNEEFKLDKKERSAMQVMLTIIREKADNLYREFSFCYRTYKTLEDHPVNKNSDTTKALKYYIRKVNERFKGKNNPVDFMLSHYIRFTPLLGYSTYCVRNNKDLWVEIKERLPYMRLLMDEPFHVGHNEESLRLHEKLLDIIEYCYKNGRVNHIQRRMEELRITEEDETKKKAEREAAKQAKIDAALQRHIQMAIDSHNNWYLAPSYKSDGSYNNIGAKYPRGYKNFIDNNDLDIKHYVILAAKRDSNIAGSNKYVHGYLSDNPKPIGFNLNNVYLYKTLNEAKDAIKEFKEKGVIMAGTPIII